MKLIFSIVFFLRCSRSDEIKSNELKPKPKIDCRAWEYFNSHYSFDRWMHITHSNGSLKYCDDLNVIRKLSHAFFSRSFDCFQNSEPPQFNNQNNHWEKRISISSLVHSYLFLLLFSSFFLVIFGVYFFSASLFWFNECITIQCLLTKRTFYKFNSVAKDKKNNTHRMEKRSWCTLCVLCVQWLH